MLKAGDLTLTASDEGLVKLHPDGSPGARAKIDGYSMPFIIAVVMFGSAPRKQKFVLRRLCDDCHGDMLNGIACAREDCTSEPLKGVKTVLDLKLKLREVNASSLEEWYVNGSDASILEAVLISEQAAMLIERWILSLGSIAARRGA